MIQPPSRWRFCLQFFGTHNEIPLSLSQLRPFQGAENATPRRCRDHLLIIGFPGENAGGGKRFCHFEPLLYKGEKSAFYVKSNQQIP